MTSNQLDIPEIANKDPNSLEVLRAWVANNGLHVSIRGSVWEDPAAWGVLLADLARHVANMFQQEHNFDPQEVLARVGAALAAELTSPTDQPTGDMT